MKQLSFAPAKVTLTGNVDAAARFLQTAQLKDRALWAKFVQVYRDQPDSKNLGWRGEYWGKMLRGGVLVYQYTRDKELYSVLETTVRDMLTVADEDGRVSSYKREKEFCGWDIWSRKYVMLANLYFLEICKDAELKKEITSFVCGCADYMIAHLGEGKISITDASSHWLGLNSCSVLEPIVGLYKLTGEQRYLDFASYIVSTGGAKGLNLFEMAYEDVKKPYQYGVVKAYEMISTFEGLLEYALVTENEHYLTAVKRFARAVLMSEESIIGCCGITHELFDHTRTRQTVGYRSVSQETCVTVTWMKFCGRILELTGDTDFADAMERSFYNAYLGALNTEGRFCTTVDEAYAAKFGSDKLTPCIMPFDSYSPLIPDQRGKRVGGIQFFADGTYYGCCACIGSAGVGMFAKSMVMTDETGLVLNFFEKGRLTVPYGGYTFTIDVDTDYPASGEITLQVESDCPEEVTLKVRIPSFADGKGGYREYRRVWKKETISLTFDMTPKAHYPEVWEKDTVWVTPCEVDGCYNTAPLDVEYDEKYADYLAITRGPLVLTVDEKAEKSIVCQKFEGVNGNAFTLIDYASAGRRWDTPVGAWLPKKQMEGILIK